MTADRWKELLTELRRWLGPVQVTLTGGEALLQPFAVDLVSHGSSLGLFVELLTHGYWDDQSRIERLALARPGRVTLSFDGIGETHDRIRGREGFYDKTTASIQTLKRVRRENGLDFEILLKTVVMEHNLDSVAAVARFAESEGLSVFYQPIEQNYNTPDDPVWFEHSANWPRDPEKAVSAVEQLVRLKREGSPIANSVEQLEVMIPYFRDPAALRKTVQSHVAHERRPDCSARFNLQVNADGDVQTCVFMPPIGNIKERSIRDLWCSRPRYWGGGCCLKSIG